MGNDSSTVELSDVQGVVLRGYATMLASTFWLLTIKDVDAARKWLGALPLTDAKIHLKKQGATQCINIAFTHHGLNALGLPNEAKAAFPTEFIEGMNTPHRNRILGDTDDSGPDQWVWGKDAAAFDILLLLYAVDGGQLDALKKSILNDRMFRGGVMVYRELDSLTRTAGGVVYEHFGFRDGIADPAIKGVDKIEGHPGNFTELGEFLLGYKNEYSALPSSPTLTMPNGDRGDFGRNGSYLVFRHLSQDVAGFWKFIQDSLPNSTPLAQKEELAAKMVGRWPNGSPLTLDPLRQQPNSTTLADDFTYMSADDLGQRCPFGAHIRRANPRDSLEPDATTSLTKVKRHRILRRGRSYGPPLVPDYDIGKIISSNIEDDGKDRGLYFICFNADIERQFEFIQQTWLNSQKFRGLYSDSDQIVNDLRQTTEATFTIPGVPVRRRITDFKDFVSTRGGGYFFVPGLRAVQFLANPKDQLADVQPPASAGSSAGTFASEVTSSRPFVYLTRQVLRLAAWLRPTWNLGGNVLVTRYRDVIEILERNQDFTIRQINGANMEKYTGRFFLGMDRGPEYDRERGLVQAAIHMSQDLDAIKKMTASYANDLIKALPARGQLDVEKDFSTRVPWHLVAEFFGTPGPDEKVMIDWLIAAFRGIFLNLGNDPEVEREAHRASDGLATYLNQRISQLHEDYKSGKGVSDSFIGRLVQAQKSSTPSFDDEGIRRNVAGVIVGAVETTSTAFIHLLDQLLSRPESLAQATAAAQAGDLDKVRAFAYEALRFNPHNPVILRYSEEAQILKSGALIPAKSTVYACTWSAMFDGKVFVHPGRFSGTRPEKNYLHFGFGMHRCFGEFINGVQIPLMLMAFLKLPNLRRAPSCPVPGLSKTKQPLLKVTFGESATAPPFITVPPSPACEAGRWMLDRLAVSYQEQPHVPIIHVITTLIKAGTVDIPVLLASKRSFHGPDGILEYIKSDRHSRELAAHGKLNERQFKSLFDHCNNVLGMSTASWAYSFLLPNKQLTLSMWTPNTPCWERWLGVIVYPLLARILKSGWKIPDDATETEIPKILESFEVIDELLADGRHYLNGTSFSALDIILASMTAPAVWPDNYGGAKFPFEQIPANIRAQIDAFRSTVTGRFCLRMYAEERYRRS